MFPEGLGDKLHQAASRRRPSEIQFTARLRENGFPGVILTQCNSIEGLLKHMWSLNLDPKEDFQVYPMTHEHSIPGMIAGSYLSSGDKIAAIFQNSGLPNAGDGFISFAENYGIPMLAITTYRGIGERSYPHQSIAKRTISLARTLLGRRDGVYGSALGSNILASLDRATNRVMGREFDKEGKEKPPQAILLLPKGAVLETLPKSPANKANTDYLALDPEVRAKKGTDLVDYFEREEVGRDEALLEIMQRHPDALIIFCNGFTARAALRVKDRLGNFYNAAYMGGGKSIGLGAAFRNPKLNVVVVDGDENAQMGSHMYDVLNENYPDNLDIYTLNNGGASSVGAAIPSVRLGPSHYDYTHVIRTKIDDLTNFAHPRVEDGVLSLYDPKDAEILEREGLELKEITRRLRRWMEQEGKDSVKVPTAYRGILS